MTNAEHRLRIEKARKILVEILKARIGRRLGVLHHETIEQVIEALGALDGAGNNEV